MPFYLCSLRNLSPTYPDWQEALRKGEITSVMNHAVDDDVGGAGGRLSLGTLFLCSDL